MQVLTKSYRTMPDKWHGLADVEKRYRQRYVDLIASPAVKDTFQKRSLILSTLRRSLEDSGFLEVETPVRCYKLYHRAGIYHHNSISSWTGRLKSTVPDVKALRLLV